MVFISQLFQGLPVRRAAWISCAGFGVLTAYRNLLGSNLTFACLKNSSHVPCYQHMFVECLDRVERNLKSCGILKACVVDKVSPAPIK